ncbi:MAG: hypothetical protein A3J97_15710 [Spirochaetes bacterium RIFOXYC1_FULL_54_7]|nr:MAG: hypothetical protein A3J97_15710 [Spirochaetes bacterium RIFOXYC1_FULL_54_7]
MSQAEIFQALHPDPNKNGTRVTKATYEAYRTALLQVIPAREAGIAFADLSQAVRPHLAQELLNTTSPTWWVTTVKLDLEARGLIERIPGTGKQRVRRCSESSPKS